MIMFATMIKRMIPAIAPARKHNVQSLVGSRMAQLLKDCHQGRNEIQALTKRPLLRADGVVIEQHEPAERINRDVYWISHPIDPTPRRCCVAWRSTTACTDRDKLS